MPHATIRTIPPGIGDEAFIEPVELGDYVLYLGRLDTHHKGLDLLLEAWSAKCQSAQIPLVIAGDGLDREKLQSEVRRRKLDNIIRLVGRVEGAAKKNLFQKARIVVVPSRYETFGLAALEGMAASKPVVCFDIEHLNEVAAAPWAISIPVFDTAAFGQAVADLWGQPKKCHQLGADAQKRARGYHWDEIARKQEEFYLQIIQSSHETS